MTVEAANAVCVIGDVALKRRLKRSLPATGATIEFVDTVAAARGSRPKLLFLDQDSRRDEELPHLLQVMDPESRIVILGESIADDQFVQLMLRLPFDHVVDGDADESEIVVTSVKLLTGDIFGLDKYLSWGSELYGRTVTSYEDKLEAIADVSRLAKEAGARRMSLAKIENVADELLMNALYDAPASVEEERTVHPPTITFGCDGRYLGMSVVDHYGELEKQTILDNLLRARSSGGQPRAMANGSKGAGLGIYFILSSVDRYVANIETGVKTEVICLFDLRKSGKDQARCAESLSIFTTGIRRS